MRRGALSRSLTQPARAFLGASVVLAAAALAAASARAGPPSGWSPPPTFQESDEVRASKPVGFTGAKLALAKVAGSAMILGSAFLFYRRLSAQEEGKEGPSLGPLPGGSNDSTD